jgi:hypothetical protein
MLFLISLLFVGRCLTMSCKKILAGLVWVLEPSSCSNLWLYPLNSNNRGYIKVVIDDLGNAKVGRTCCQLCYMIERPSMLLSSLWVRLELGDDIEVRIRDAGSYTRWRDRAELDTKFAREANSFGLGWEGSTEVEKDKTKFGSGSVYGVGDKTSCKRSVTALENLARLQVLVTSSQHVFVFVWVGVYRMQYWAWFYLLQCRVFGRDQLRLSIYK